ncbi:MAG: hypothetical protein GY861_04105, partial [bacterium]|nr:hypothetical protein [bacterium]
MDLQTEVEDLRKRVERLEQKSGGAPERRFESAPLPPPPLPVQSGAQPVSAEPREKGDFESFVGRRLLGVVGVLAIII